MTTTEITPDVGQTGATARDERLTAIFSEIAAAMQRAVEQHTPQTTGYFYSPTYHAYCALGWFARNKGWDPTRSIYPYLHEIAGVYVPAARIARAMLAMGRNPIPVLGGVSKILLQRLIVKLNDQDWSFSELHDLFSILAHED